VDRLWHSPKLNTAYKANRATQIHAHFHQRLTLVVNERAFWAFTAHLIRYVNVIDVELLVHVVRTRLTTNAIFVCSSSATCLWWFCGCRVRTDFYDIWARNALTLLWSLRPVNPVRGCDSYSAYTFCAVGALFFLDEWTVIYETHLAQWKRHRVGVSVSAWVEFNAPPDTI